MSGKYFYATEIEEYPPSSHQLEALPPEVKMMKTKAFREIVSEIGWYKFRFVMHYMYGVLGMGTISIGKLIGRSDETVRNWLRRLDIEVKPHKYKVYTRLGKREEWRVEVIDEEQVKTHVIVPDEDLVRLIFFAIGDGTVSEYLIQIYSTEKTFLPIHQRRMSRYGSVFKEYYDQRGRRVKTLEQAYRYRLTLNNAEIARLIANRYGLRYDTIQSCLQDKKLAPYSIASLWDADGSVPKDKTKKLGFRAEITQSHIPEVGKNAIRLLTYIKISLKRHWKIQSHLRLLGNRWITQYYRRPIKTPKPRYILHIAQKDLLTFAKEIGEHFEHPEKRKRAKLILKRA